MVRRCFLAPMQSIAEIWRHGSEPLTIWRTPAHTYAFLQDTFLDVCMKETVQSYFAMLQPKESRLRKRLQAASNRLYDLNFTNSAIKGVRIPRIILKKNYHKAIGILEVALKVDARLIALPSRLFIHTNLALCYFAIGRSRKAAEHLEFTLSLAERDQVLSFAAYFREYLEPLFYLPSVSRKYAAVIQEIRSLPIQNIPAVPEWKAFIPKQENEWEEPLSKREREIAELAARGLRNGEIAEMLHISEGTVKNHLKIVFRKLNIDRRSSLRTVALKKDKNVPFVIYHKSGKICKIKEDRVQLRAFVRRGKGVFFLQEGTGADEQYP